MENIEILENPTNNNSYIKVLLKSTDDTHYIDTSLVNILRRFIISNIDTYTFFYINKENIYSNVKEIKIKEDNKTNINNDMLSHRISLLPINVFALEILILFNYHKSKKQFEIDNFEIKQEDLYSNQLKFYIEQEYESEQQSNYDYMDITDNHIKNDLFAELIEQKTDEAQDFIKYLNEIGGEEKLEKKYDEKLPNNDLKELKLFKPYIHDDDEYYNIITKIKYGQKINLNMYLMKSSVSTDNYTDNNIRYSPVAACRSTFAINYNKVLQVFNEKKKDEDSNWVQIEDINFDNLINNDNLDELNGLIVPDILKEFKYFCIEEGERYYHGIDNQKDRKHILEYESIDFYKPKIILKKGLEALKGNKINNQDFKFNNIQIFDEIGKSLENNLPIKTNQYKITYSQKIDNCIDILIDNGNHGLGYLMQTYLDYIDTYKKQSIQENKHITYIGYKMIHPLETKLLLSIQCNKENLSQIFKNTHEYLQQLLENLLGELD